MKTQENQCYSVLKQKDILDLIIWTLYDTRNITYLVPITGSWHKAPKSFATFWDMGFLGLLSDTTISALSKGNLMGSCLAFT